MVFSTFLHSFTRSQAPWVLAPPSRRGGRALWVIVLTKASAAAQTPELFSRGACFLLSHQKRTQRRILRFCSEQFVFRIAAGRRRLHGSGQVSRMRTTSFY